MPDQTREDRARLAAARCGLKLIRSRQSASSPGEPNYCLRPVWDVSQIVAPDPAGGFGLVSTNFRGWIRREAAIWLSLSTVEQVLRDWRPETTPRARKPLSRLRRRSQLARHLQFGLSGATKAI